MTTGHVTETGRKLPSNPAAAVQEVIQTIGALKSIYLEENAALENLDSKQFLALQDRKNEIAEQYKQEASQIIARKDEMNASVPEMVRENFHKAEKGFSTVAARNAQLLIRMNNSFQRLNERIMDAARQAIEKQGVNYSASGEMNQKTQNVSIRINESA